MPATPTPKKRPPDRRIGSAYAERLRRMARPRRPSLVLTPRPPAGARDPRVPRRLRTPGQHGPLSAAAPRVGRAGDALDDVEVGHHRHVLVLEVVAVEDVAPAIAGEPRDDLGFLFGPQVDGVLPADVIRPRPPPGAGKDLEVREVQVDGVVRVRDQAPDLGRAQPRPRIGPVRLESLAVNGPYGAGPRSGAEGAPGEDEAPGHRRRGPRRALECGQPGRHGAVIACPAGNVEAHHAARRTAAETVRQGHPGADRVAGEIHDHVEPLGLRDLDLLVADRPFEQPYVAADLGESRALAWRRVEGEAVAARV